LKNEPTDLRAARRFREKKSETLSHFDRRVKQPSGASSRTRARATGSGRLARSTRAGPIDGEKPGGTRDVCFSAVSIAKRSRARGVSQKRHRRGGASSRAGGDA